MSLPERVLVPAEEDGSWHMLTGRSSPEYDGIHEYRVLCGRRVGFTAYRDALGPYRRPCPRCSEVWERRKLEEAPITLDQGASLFPRYFVPCTVCGMPSTARRLCVRHYAVARRAGQFGNAAVKKKEKQEVG